MQGYSLRIMWFGVLATLFATGSALWAVGIHVFPGPKGLVLCWSAALWLAVCFIIRPQQSWAQRVLALGNGLLLLTLIALAGGLLSYWTTRLSPFPWADPVLYGADLMLGLDWQAAYKIYLRYPDIHLPMQNLYLAIFEIPKVTILGLAITGQETRIRDFIAVFSIALALTISISFFLPAATPLFYLIGESPPYIPATGATYFSIMTELRSGAPMHVDLHELYGLLTFPSFHAASAVIFAWAGWSLTYLRWPLVAVNIGMLAATPLEGAHYFVDVIGGGLVALAAISIVQSRSQQTNLRTSRTALFQST